MLLGGLWYGANWTFIFWGLFHGSILIAYKAYDYKFKAKLLVRRNPIYHITNLFFLSFSLYLMDILQIRDNH